MVSQSSSLGVVPAVLAAVGVAALGASARAQLTWTQRAVLAPSARTDTAMAHDAVRAESILFGGHDGASGFGDTWRWDGLEWIEVDSATSPSARWQHAMVAVGGGQLLLFGGQDGIQPLADTWLWNGTHWARLDPATAPSPRRGHSMAYDSVRDRVVLFGGIGSLGYLADTWEWDGFDWVLVPVAGPTARAFQGMEFDASPAPGRSLVVLFGGEAPNLTPLNETWAWNGIAWTRRTPSTNPAARSRSPLAYDALHQRVVMFGGKGASAALGETYTWTGTNWVRQTPSPAPAAGYGHGLCYHHQLGGARTVLFGGGATSPPTLTDTWEWGGTAWIKSSTELPSMRRWSSMAYDRLRARTVMFGGEAAGVIGDTWEWDGIRWWRRATTGPTARKAFALVYDTARSRTVLFGGANAAGSTFNAETWEWSGTAWTRITTATSPPAMWQHGMAYDSGRAKTVLFGGTRPTGASDRTWEYDGTTWAERLPQHRPPPISGSPMCFDAERGRTVLADSGGSAIDVWEWDGTDWFHAAPSSVPPALFQPTMVYDAARARSVLVGYRDGGTETWEWDGIDWHRKSTAQQMGERTLHASAYDSARRCVVVFGGWSSVSTPLQDTWEYTSGSYASYAPFGVGCLGSRGVPELAATPGSRPAIGDVLRIDVTILPLVSTPTVMCLGFSRAQMSGVPLPIDLGLIGMPGCSLYQSTDLTFGITNAYGAARWTLGLPQNESLLGMLFYNQAIVMDRNANPIELIVSNAGEGQIGS